MQTYTFALEEKTFTTEAATYAEALADLIFEVGSEAGAAEYTFITAEAGAANAARILEEIREAAPKGCYHAKIHLAEKLPLGGLNVVRIAHLTRIDDTPLSAVCVEDAQTHVQEYSSLSELATLIGALIIERVDYLVNGYQAGWASQ